MTQRMDWSGRLHRGMEVLDTDGDKVGKVDDVRTDGDAYIGVKTGVLGMGTYWYVPMSAIKDVDPEADCVSLNVQEQDIDQMAWTEPPRGEPTTASGWAATAQAPVEERTVHLREEELQARKQPVETGEVRVSKEIITENRTVEVPVTREEVVVEHHPIDRQAAARPVDEGEEIRIPVREERVTVEKQPVVTGEVSVRKEPIQETRTVAGDVSHEELRVEREGDVEVRGNVAGTVAGSEARASGSQHEHTWMSGRCSECGMPQL